MVAESDQLNLLMQKIRQYPVNVQKHTIRLFLSYVLRHDSKEDVTSFCESMLRAEKMDSKVLGQALAHQIHDEVIIKQRISQKLENIIHQMTTEGCDSIDVYDRLAQLESLCENVKSSVKKIAEKTKKCEAIGTVEMLHKVESDLSYHEEAMMHAAEVLFDRIFESVNPESAASYLDQSVLQVGPLKKAAMYDATKDKYNQILEYHQMGKFKQDFTVIYKRYLRKMVE